MASRILGEGASRCSGGEEEGMPRHGTRVQGAGLLFTRDKAAEGLAGDAGVRKESEQELPRRWVSEHQGRCLGPRGTQTHRGGVPTQQGLGRQAQSWASPSQAPFFLLALCPQRAVSILARASLLTSRLCARGHTGHGAGRGQDQRLRRLICSPHQQHLAPRHSPGSFLSPLIGQGAVPWLSWAIRLYRVRLNYRLTGLREKGNMGLGSAAGRACHLWSVCDPWSDMAVTVLGDHRGRRRQGVMHADSG